MSTIGQGTTNPNAVYDPNRQQDATNLTNTVEQAVASQTWGQQFIDQYEASNISDALLNGNSITQSGNNSDIYEGFSSDGMQSIKNALYNIVAESPLGSEAWDDLYAADLVPNVDTQSGQTMSLSNNDSGQAVVSSQAASPQAATQSPPPGNTGTSAAAIANYVGGAGTGTGVLSTGNVTGSPQTGDGYTVQDCKNDMATLAASQGGSVPPEPLYTEVAQGIIDGINNNFSGQNLIGDYSGVSGADMAKSLIASAWQESRFGVAGETPGGVYQCTQGRLDQYNEYHGTNYSLSQITNDAALSVTVGLWCMANPISIVGVPASGQNSIPSSLEEQALYYWNYNPNPDQNGNSNQLSTYIGNTENFAETLGSNVY